MSGLPPLYRPSDAAMLTSMLGCTGAPVVFRNAPPFLCVASGADYFYGRDSLAGDIEKPKPKEEQAPAPKPAPVGRFLCADGTWRDEPEKPEPIPEPTGPSRAQLRRERLTAELRTALDRTTK